MAGSGGWRWELDLGFALFFCFLCRGFQNLMGFLSFSGEVSLDLLVFIFLLLSDLIDLGLKHETETK